MPNLTSVIGADTSKFVQEIKSAKDMLENFVSETKTAKEAVNDNVSATNEQVNAYKKVVKTLEQVANGTMNTKQQQQSLAASVKELKIQWANLSNTAKTSNFGKTLGSTLVESQSKLGQLTTQIKQADAELGNFGGGSVKRQLADLSKNLTNLTVQYRMMSDAEKQSSAGQELQQKLSDLRQRAGQLKDAVIDTQREIKVLASDTPNLDVFNNVISLSGQALSTYSSIIAKVTGDEKALKDAIATVMMVQSASNFLTKLTNELQSSSALMLKIRSIQEKAAAAAIKIRSAAEAKGTTITKTATIAQKAFNAVAKANPYVLLATAILAAGAAIFAFTSKTREASAAEQQAQREAEELKNKQEELQDINTTAGQTIAKFVELQAQWRALRTEAEKKRWLAENKTAFEALGMSIDSVNDAENIYNKNTPAVVEAIVKRAVAAKLVEQASEELVELYKKYKSHNVNNGYYYNPVHADDKISDEEARAAGVPTTAERRYAVKGEAKGTYLQPDRQTVHFEYRPYTPEQQSKINANRAKEALERQRQSDAAYKAAEQKITNDIIDYTNQGNAAEAVLRELGVGLKTYGSTSGGAHTSRHGSNNTSHGDTTHDDTTDNKPDYAQGSLSDLEAQLSELQKKWKDGLYTGSKEAYEKELANLETQIHKKKIELELEFELPEGSLEKLNKDIEEKQNELKLAVDDESRNRIQHQIDVLVGKKNAIELRLKPVVEAKDIADLEADINNHSTQVRSQITDQMTSGQKLSKAELTQFGADIYKEELEYSKELLSQYKELYEMVQQRQQAGAQITADEQKLVSIYEATKKSVDELAESYNNAANNATKLRLNSELNQKTWETIKTGVDTLGNLNTTVTNTSNAWTSLIEKWNDMSTFEKVTSGFDTTISTIQSVIGAYEAITSIIKLFGEISELTTAKKVAGASAEAAAVSSVAAAEVAANTSVAASEVASNTTQMASDIAASAANQILTATENTAAYAAIPFMGPALATGAMAQYKGIWAAAAIPMFGDGGIFRGLSTIGDYNIARVNGGEMIMNGTQQKRLFNILNGEGVLGTSNSRRKQNVNFVIKGKALRATLRNYDTQQSKI